MQECNLPRSRVEALIEKLPEIFTTEDFYSECMGNRGCSVIELTGNHIPCGKRLSAHSKEFLNPIRKVDAGPPAVWKKKA